MHWTLYLKHHTRGAETVGGTGWGRSLLVEEV